MNGCSLWDHVSWGADQGLKAQWPGSRWDENNLEAFIYIDDPNEGTDEFMLHKVIDGSEDQTRIQNTKAPAM